MLAELAAQSIFLGFTATPPHLTAELATMRAARPIEILMFSEVEPAELARLLFLHVCESFGLELSVSLLHLGALSLV